MSYKIHPAAELFPQMSDEEFDALVADIKENGLRDPIVIWADDRLIDGRHRLKACKKLGIEPEVRQLGGDVDPYKFVVSTNLHRRHLTETQRGMVSARLATLKRGGDRRSEDFKGPIDPLKSSINEAAELLNVSPKTVKRCKQVLEHGSKELITACDKGDVKVSFATKFIEEVPDKEAQSSIVKKGKDAMRAAMNIEPAKPRSVVAKPKRKDAALPWVKAPTSTFQEHVAKVSRLGRCSKQKMEECLGGVTNQRWFKTIVAELHYMKIVSHPDGTVELVIDEDAKTLAVAVKKHLDVMEEYCLKHNSFKADYPLYRKTVHDLHDLVKKVLLATK